jgi:AcrR family transcriptional regulator
MAQVSFLCQDSAVPGKLKRTRLPKTYHHGNLREALLTAGAKLLAQRGAAQLTLRDIAKAAQVSHAAPYHHFASLEELLAAIAEQGFSALAEAMASAAKAKDFRERLVAICAAYVAFGRAQPALFRLMFGPVLTQKDRYLGLKTTADSAFSILLMAALDYDPAEGQLLALTGWSLAHGLANLSIDGAFDTLPIAVEDSASLARLMAERMLPLGQSSVA